MSLKSAATLSIIALLSAGTARAATVHFAATLTGGDAAPANASPGHGQLTAELETDEKTLVYRANYSGLSGPAVAADFHGPAAPGAQAPPSLAVPNPVSPISGVALLTSDDVDNILAGRWSFDVHTRAYPGGEIRGQLKRDG
jgi:hypothetical protein